MWFIDDDCSVDLLRINCIAWMTWILAQVSLWNSQRKSLRIVRWRVESNLVDSFCKRYFRRYFTRIQLIRFTIGRVANSSSRIDKDAIFKMDDQNQILKQRLRNRLRFGLFWVKTFDSIWFVLNENFWSIWVKQFQFCLFWINKTSFLAQTCHFKSIQFDSFSNFSSNSIDSEFSVRFESIQLSSIQFNSIRNSSDRFNSTVHAQFRVSFGSVQFISSRFDSINFNSIHFTEIRFNSIRFNESFPIDAIQFDSVRLHSVQIDSTRFSSTQFDSVQFDSMRFDAIHFSSIRFEFESIQTKWLNFNNILIRNESLQFSSTRLISLRFDLVQIDATQFSLIQVGAVRIELRCRFS